MIDVTLIGCGGTMPLPGRALSALAVRCGGRVALVDCGEGTQAAARAAGVSLVKADVLCLTHYHGDHIFGVPGLLQTMANLGRTEPVRLIGPEGLNHWGRLLLALAGPLPFPVEFEELPMAEKELELPGFCGLVLTAFPLAHRVPCMGYAFRLPRAGRFLPAKALLLDVPQSAWKLLQQGEAAVLPDGRVILPQQVLGPAREELKLVYATDTSPCTALETAARNADLLIMDATYPAQADADKAAAYGHSTFAQTAALAVRTGAKRLWLTHYSGAVSDPTQALAEIQDIYPGAVAGRDGLTTTLAFAGR